MSLSHEWKLSLFPRERIKRWTGKQAYLFGKEGVGMGCIVVNNKREHISRRCGPLEMCRKNSLYSSLVLLEEVPSHFWVNCLSWRLAFRVGYRSWVWICLGGRKVSIRISQEICISISLVCVLALSLSNAHFDLFILRIPGSMCYVSVWAWQLTLYSPFFLPTLPRNGLKWSLWGSVGRMGTKPVLWECREVFFTVLRQVNSSSREHLSLGTRGREGCNES